MPRATLPAAPSGAANADLTRFEQMTLGVSFHFGMNTFTGNDYDEGTAPPSTYAPTELNPDQWLAAAEQAGASYAILTAKHMSGFCLWPSEDYAYSVAHSGDKTDVVAAFVSACRKRRIVPGLYYCILDPRNEGNQGHVDWAGGISDAYFALILRQVRELHARYGPIGLMLFDIPGKLSPDERWRLYRTVKSINSHCLVMMNQTWPPSQANRGRICDPSAWPSDIVLAEDAVPAERHNPVIEYSGERYYLPMASWIPTGPPYRSTSFREWFWSSTYRSRPASELDDLYHQTVSRNASFLPNFSPDTCGLLPDDQLSLLRQLGRRNPAL